ncbi:hypothetical protein M407DRAFT_17311 [Tulasnella calospora MUT 4182]|uniref:Uncharacterized protein n=1 Tax=Tulasnella calospora MUT 4182 TaxID=1051891 RepID=A0A0C3QY17_9AGAM|nr:hypothetical protein M407DRAFT_17311 [Tulasnella calospora MUT 4182]
MSGQRSLLLSFVVALFVSISSVWAKNVTVPADDTRLVFTNQTSSLTGGWMFNTTGLCGSEGGIVQTYTPDDSVSLQFNGTAVYVVFAEYDMAAMTNVTIDGVQANVTAQNASLSLTSNDCQTRTLYAVGMVNANHTVTVAFAGTGLGRTVLNQFIFDDGAETPAADPTATRLPVAIFDTGASTSTPTPTPSATPTYTSSPSSDGGFDCGTGCKATSIGGIIGLIFTAIFMYWLWKCCCCGGSRETVTETVYVQRPASPKPQPIIVYAATLEVQQTQVQVQAVDRNSAVITAPPAYVPPPTPAREQTNYR